MNKSRTSSRPRRSLPGRNSSTAYPFAAIVGQEKMKLALLLNVIDSSIGGVLIMGHRGTGKSTAVRGMADLLPPIASVDGWVYGCDPPAAATLCASCRASEGKFKSQRKP